MVRHRLGELVADGFDGVEGGHRVLEDHRHPLPADGSPFPGRHADEFAVAVADRTADRRGGLLEQSEEREDPDALARAGLPNDREGFRRAEVVGDAVDDVGDAPLGAEAHPEVPHGEDGVAGGAWGAGACVPGAAVGAGGARGAVAAREARAAAGVGVTHTDCPRDSITDFCRGSRASRRPSPTKLNAMTVTRIATPGKMPIHGACSKKLRPSLSIRPQAGLGG
jgi:hypothetical protein